MLSFLSSSKSSAQPKSQAPAERAKAAPSSAARQAPASDDVVSPELTSLLDAVGGLLQLYGQHAFDTDIQSGEEIRSLVHRWRLHATLGAPSPVVVEQEPAGGITARDWKGLIRFFGTTRRDEAAYVQRAQGNLRESIWAFVSGLHKLVVEEHEEDKIVQEHISRVRAAVTSQDTTDLKRETMAAVQAMEALTKSRRERQRQQFSVLAEKLKDLGRELEDARRESALDGLTRLPNRRAFDEYITRSIELHSLMGRPASLLLIDVDDFKVINDTFGHPVGDDALRQVTRALSRTVLRKVDFVCRLGGDEFAVILQETDGQDAIALGEKLRRSVADVLDAQREGDPVLEYTISVGVAELQLGDDALAWINRADKALYQAKRLGRDQVVISGDHRAPMLVQESAIA